jgi:hypothetical protein
VGAGLVGLAAWDGLSWYELLVGLVALPAAATIALGLRGRNAAPLRLDGPAVCVACGLGAALFIGLPEVAMVFFGVSMLLAAARRDTGCELFAISNWVLGRDDQLACPVFGPIDVLEARRAHDGQPDRADVSSS